jgi:primosomal protein N' (replication factor Y) (superfamily II helicase)
MRYAEVSVNTPAAKRRSFSYSIPSSLHVEAGQAVRVPFGSRVLEGIVIELTEFPAVEQTRDICDILDEKPVIFPVYLNLARWISDYYLSPLFDAIALMLPPGFERKSITFISLTGKTIGPDEAPLSVDQQHIIDLINNKNRIRQKEIEKLLGEKRALSVISQLVNRGLVTREYQLEAERIKPKYEEYLTLTTPLDNLDGFNDKISRSPNQVAVVRYLASQSLPVTWTSLKQNQDVDRTTLKALVKKNIIKIDSRLSTRDPLAEYKTTPDKPLTLTPEQTEALGAINSSLQRKQVPGLTFLLHGVTGSGKTEIYLQTLTEAIRLGKQGIVLVPEISLTPQTIARFTARFPHRVAVLHSHLSLREQFDEWHRIQNGDFDVVIGPRSALFAPLPNPGLIIIDEEHEWTYKQTEKSPRYHARDVAIKLAELTGATVVLGSATPDVGTYTRSLRGEFKLLSLPERVTPVRHTPLPVVEIVDLKKELKSGTGNIFSQALKDAVTQAVSHREQAILFLNRRGASTFIQCRKCGFILRCRRCEVSLTFHSVSNTLVCHQCNYRRHMYDVCPRCGSPQIKFLGTGTQKLEEEAKLVFPSARILRWDSDATRQKGSHESIMKTFASHEADILIGTQMVTKGLDIPLVTVVGVVNADVALNFPHYLAAERTFQLLSQVAGRAGRGERGGQVILQTYNPEHFVIQAASQHDYSRFYEKEASFRRQLGYPPFSRLASLMYSHSNETKSQNEADRFGKVLNQQLSAQGIAGLSIIGPAPAYLYRLRGRYRWQIIIRGTNPAEFLASIPLPQGWSIDIDPVGLS